MYDVLSAYRSGLKIKAIVKKSGLSRLAVLQLAAPEIHRQKDAKRRKPLARRATDVRFIPPVLNDTRDLTARLAGDPLPGRSALEKMMAAGRSI